MRVTSTQRVCAIRGRVTHHERVCSEHVALSVDVGRFPPSQPGQFLQILCREDDAGVGRAFLRRPFSIADHVTDDAGRSTLRIISRRVGVGTAWLDRRRAGDALDVSGPFGHGFELPKSDAPIVLVGGGVGIPPLLYLCRVLASEGRANAYALFGATSRNLLPIKLSAEPDRNGRPIPCAHLPGDAAVPVAVTSDDGTCGMRGRVTDALERWYGETRPPQDALVCACGPESMLRAVAALSRRWRLRCQLCIERTMACGMGTCLSCVVRRRDADRPEGWRWALACTEGPVFSRDDLPDYDAPVSPAGERALDSA
ncbi:MAG: hypothetical protein D6744_10325 [Planctomycetota bacterium]|nr:MAG: hypothetical protein D6744_10325 [Planctomycetota bacterium]